VAVFILSFHHFYRGAVMKIAVNTRLLLKGKLDGIGWFTYENFKRIVSQHPEHEFHFIFDRGFDNEFIFAKNVFPHVIGPQARHPFLYKIWYDISLPFLLRKIKADILISPDAQVSLRTRIPQLVVIHDLNFEHYPKGIPPVYSWYFRKYSAQFAHKAKRIATVSAFSKSDIISNYNIFKENIDVVFNGVNESYHQISSELQSAVRNKISGSCDFFIAVSSMHPRKNLQRLIPAFDLFKKKSGSNVKLVVVGSKFWFDKEMKQALKNARHIDDIVFTGRMEATDLMNAVGSALASVYVSYFEGFGIPVVEAFRCGTPVIASSVTSLPEVAGAAAVLVDPFSIEAIANALHEVWQNKSLRNDLIQKGLKRAEEFTWERSASLLWQSIEKTLGK
jgi:glycosyltransferase involved in cell wall biosynthesis